MEHFPQSEGERRGEEREREREREREEEEGETTPTYVVTFREFCQKVN